MGRVRVRFIFAVSVAALWALLAGRAHGQFVQQAELSALDSGEGDRFGVSIALSGDTIVVGASGDDGVASNSGAAYVFTRSGNAWAQQAKLVALDGEANDTFGSSVAISGDTAVVGAPRDDDEAVYDGGAAYVFVRSGSVWTQEAKLVATDAASFDYLGISVAVDGDTVFVGAQDERRSGSVSIFSRSEGAWTQQTKFVAADGAAGDLFGLSVALEGDTAVIGAFGDDDAGDSSGSAYVFVRSGIDWIQEAKLVAMDAGEGDRFGQSIAISGDTAIIGATLDDEAASNTGAAYVFTRAAGAWSQEAKLLASDAVADDYFGFSVAVSGDRAAVGAVWDDDGGFDTGSVYVYRRADGVWTQQHKLGAPEAAADDHFGLSIALQGETVAVGTSLRESVFIFVEPVSVLDFLLGSEGTPPDLNGDGIVDVADLVASSEGQTR